MREENKISEDEEKQYSTFDVHLMLNARAGEEIPEYRLRTLMECWRISKGLQEEEEQNGFTKAEADDFLAYAY